MKVAFHTFDEIFFRPALECAGDVRGDVTVQTTMVAAGVRGEAVLFWTRAKFVSPRIEIPDHIQDNTNFSSNFNLIKKRRDKGPNRQPALTMVDIARTNHPFGQPAEPRRSDPSRIVRMTFTGFPRRSRSSAFETIPTARCSGFLGIGLVPQNPYQ